MTKSPVTIREQDSVADAVTKLVSNHFTNLPVVDAQGRVVGVLIARAPFIESLILPASEVRASLEQLRKEALDRK